MESTYVVNNNNGVRISPRLVCINISSVSNFDFGTFKFIRNHKISILLKHFRLIVWRFSGH